MSQAIDSSILVAAVVSTEIHHLRCRSVIERGGFIYSHGLTETFNTLTGGRLALRVSSSSAATLLEEDLMPTLTVVLLDPSEILRAFRQAESAGVRGGAIFDYLHWVAAKKAGAEKFVTLNLSDFRSFYRPGDPEPVLP